MKTKRILKKLDIQESVKKCKTPISLEKLFQREINKDIDTSKNHNKLRTICNIRVSELSKVRKNGNLLAIRLDKNTGCSARYIVNGEKYKTGCWGNGAGYRWAMHDFKLWYEKKLKAGGLSKRKIDSIIEWTISGYLWRALQILDK